MAQQGLPDTHADVRGLVGDADARADVDSAVAPSPSVPFAPPVGLPRMPAPEPTALDAAPVRIDPLAVPEPHSPDRASDLSTRADQLLALIAGNSDDDEPVSVTVLTNRKIPRVRATIDRLIVAPSGIWIVDQISGPNEVAVVAASGSRSLFRRRRGPRLMVDGKDKTKLLRNARLKTEAIVGALELLGKGGVPVHRVSCFITADVANDGSEVVEGATIMSRQRLDEMIELPGPVASGTVETLATQLASRFPQG